MTGISVVSWMRLKTVYLLADEVYYLVNSWVDDEDPTRFITQWDQRFFLRRLVERSFRVMEGGNGITPVAPHITLEGELVMSTEAERPTRVDEFNLAIEPCTLLRTDRQKCLEVLEYLGNEVPTYEPNNGITGFTRDAQRRIVGSELDDEGPSSWLPFQYDWCRPDLTLYNTAMVAALGRFVERAEAEDLQD